MENNEFKRTKRRANIIISVIFGLLIAFFIGSIIAVNIGMSQMEKSFIDFMESLPKYEDVEVGDFNVRFYEDEDYCEIVGTTQQGNENKFLVIPEYVNGVRVDALGVYNWIWFGVNKYSKPVIESEILEKVYFESDIKVSSYAFNGDYPCLNLDKIICSNIPDEYYYVINYSEATIYCPKIDYDNRIKDDYFNQFNPANVSYYYNYENTEDDEYYWIDDYNYGEKIDYVPTSPTRDGYTFGGWFTDTECTSEWDFDMDTLPELKMMPIPDSEKEWYPSDQTETIEYQETILYAKWTEV